MRNAKLWSVLCAAVLLCACVVGVLFTGASASDSRIPEATTTYVVGTDGDTIRACLDKAAEETWGATDVLEIEFSGSDGSIYAKPDVANGIGGYTMFETATIFREDNTKLPIVITGTDDEKASTITTPSNGYNATNDYHFNNLTIAGGSSGKSVTFYAGCGELVFENVHVGSIAYTYFYGDCQVMDCFVGWTEEHVKANVNEDGLLETGMILGNGCTGLNTSDAKLPSSNNDMHITAVGSNGNADTIPEIYSLRRQKANVTANLTEEQVATVQAEAESAPFQPGNLMKENCILKPWQTSTYMILDCGNVATSDSTLADYVYSGARKGISPVREARLELLSGGAQYLAADAHNSSYNETYVGDTKLILRGGRAGGYGDVGIRLTNLCMHVGNLTFEIHEDSAEMPTWTPWIQPVANSSTATTKLFGDYHFLMTGGTVGSNKTSGANGYYGAMQATGKVVNEVQGGQLYVFSTVRYGGEFAEATPVSTVLPHDGTTLTASVAVHNKISGGTFGGLTDGVVTNNTGFFGGSYDGGDANVPPSVCNEITGGTFYRYQVANKYRSSNFDSHIYNFVSGTAEEYPVFHCPFYGTLVTRTTTEVTNVIKGYPQFVSIDGATKYSIYGGTDLGTVNKITNYFGGMPVFDDFYGGGSGNAPVYEEDGETVKTKNHTVTYSIENHIALDATEKAISNYIWGGNGYYNTSKENPYNTVEDSLVTHVYSGTYGTFRGESSCGRDLCDIEVNVHGGTWKSNYMPVNRVYSSTSTIVKDYTVTNNIYGGTFEANMYMGGQNSRNQAFINNIYGGAFGTKFVSGNKTTGDYGYYGAGDSYCMSVVNNIYGGTFTAPYYGGGKDGAAESITNNIYGGLFSDQHDFMGAQASINGACPIVNNFYGGDSGKNWIYGGHRQGPCTTIENNFLSGADNPCRDSENELYEYFDASTMLEGGFKFRDQVIAGGGYVETVYNTNTCTGITNNLEGGCWTKEGGSTTYITLHGGMRWGIINGDVVNNVITGKYYRIYGGSDYGVINGDIINTYGKPLAEGEEAPELKFYNNGNSIGYIYGGGYDNVNFPSKVAAALAVEEASRTAIQKMYASLAEGLEEGETYNTTTGDITNTFYYGEFKQFFGGSYGLLTEGVTSNIASITNNVYGGTFDDTVTGSGNTEHAYYGGCLRNCTIPGGITNNIYGGNFETNYYGGTPGSGVVVCPTVTNNIYGGEGSSSGNKQLYMGNGGATCNGVVKSTFYAAGEFGPGFDAKRSYVYGGSAGTHNDTEAEFEVETAIYGGTFTGFWGVGGGSSTKMNGDVKTTVYGGTFNGYDGASLRNAIAGATRNGTMNGDVVLEILGGELNGNVVGGVNYGADSSAADVLNGNVTLIIKGGKIDGTIYGVAKGGQNVTLADGYTCTVIGEQVQGVELALLRDGTFDSFTANGETIEIGELTDIEIKALTGEISVHQTQGWQAHDYLKIPAGSQYVIVDDARYGAYSVDDTILVKGVAVVPVGATLRLGERIGVRIVLSADDVDAYGDAFTYKVKMGDTVIAEGGVDEIRENNYSILFDGIGLGSFGEEFTVTSPLLETMEYSIVELAGMAQTAWAENAKWKAYADAVIEFHNVYNLKAANSLTPDAVTANEPVAAKGELGDQIVNENTNATLLMGDAAGIRLSVGLSTIPTDAKFVVGDKEFAAVTTADGITADIFVAHEAMADEFAISVQNAEGQVYMTYTASIEALANELASDDANVNKNNATAFLVYIQKAVACK